MLTDNDNIFDITSRVAIHDVHQFEIKLEYNLEELRKTNSYRVETFLFIPKSLHINKTTYQTEEFYENLQNYIRFKTPSFSFKLILDPQFTHSPLYVLREILSCADKSKTNLERSKLVRNGTRELKMLGVMIRARFRDFRHFTRIMLTRGDKSTDYLLKRLEETLFSGIAVLEEIRKIQLDYQRACPDEKEIYRYFRVINEFASYLLEEEAIKLFKLLNLKIENNPAFEEIKQRFKDFLQEEKAYRLANDFNLSFKNTEESKEQYLYHLSQYKKIISSVLHLNIDRAKSQDKYIHLAGSAAAFTAAAIYFTITFLTANRFAINSIPFFLVLSMGYVFKDRLKDSIKFLLNPRILSHFPDHVTQIEDNSDNSQVNLGNIREKVFFSDRSRIDPIVLTMRDKTRPAAFLPEEAPEEILVYQKEINIKTEVIRENHSRTINLTDIMRLNIHRYLEKMDDPEQPINFYDVQQDHITSTHGERTYHIGLVIKYSKFSEKKEFNRYERYRVIASKWGIKRVEFVEEL